MALLQTTLAMRYGNIQDPQMLKKQAKTGMGSILKLRSDSNGPLSWHTCLDNQQKAAEHHNLSAATELLDNHYTAEERKRGSVVVIDNYDSFTYNLCQYIGELGWAFEVFRNDEISVEQIQKVNPRGILISPGPGTPKESGISMEVVRKLGPRIPLLGVCMGLQCIGEAFGGKIIRAPSGAMHGKTSPVFYQEGGDLNLFSGLPNPFRACRYHSLIIEHETFPSTELEITAWTSDGIIMGICHVNHRHMQGVQFHPESIITQEGKKIIENFLEMMELRSS